MEAEAAEKQCSNVDCRVAQTGKCVEGLALDKCPHLIRVSNGAQITVVDDNEIEAKPKDLELARSERLTPEEATVIMRAAPTHVIAIVGPTSSGKTTLIACFSDLFQKGKIGDLSFAKSRTLVAFEQACHHSRSTSRRHLPQTEHTSLASGLGFYHFGVWNSSGLRNPQLLLADRSGEDYRSVADDPTAAAEFVEVRRADVLTVLVDGARMLDMASRHNVRHDTLMILQGLVNSDVLSKGQGLALVLTKVDVISAASAADWERTEQFFDALTTQVQSIFGDAFRQIRAFRIAASPATSDFPHGFGVSSLLQFWSEAKRSEFPSLPLQKAARAMGRFGMADLGSVE